MRPHPLRVIRPASLWFALALLCGCPSPQPAPEPKAQAQAGPRTPEAAWAAALPGWAWSALPARRRAALRERLQPLLALPAEPALSELRAACLDGIQAQAVFGAETLSVAHLGDATYQGEGLSLGESEDLARAARAEASQVFAGLRYRELEDEADQIQQAALALGASPNAQALAGFRSAFQATFLVTLEVQTRFVPAAGRAPGALHVRGEALFLDRATGTVLARLRLASEDRSDARLQPLPLERTQSLSGQAERLTRSCARGLAEGLAAQVFERLYAGQ